MEKIELEKWLVSANARYRSEEIPHKHRPFKAMSDFTRELKCSLALGSPICNTIFEWFRKNSPPRAHEMGSLFTGAFYFDACFWPLFIPYGYGTFTLNPLDCLETMPEAVKEQLIISNKDMGLLTLYWADCLDYGYGFDDIQKLKPITERALLFIDNGHRELIGAIAQLATERPNTKAILSLRLAIEIFLKALLIQERNLTDKDLKKLNHSLSTVACECFNQTQIPEFKIVASTVDTFPEVSERYDGQERTLSEVWHAILVAQTAATAVVRKYSDRDVRHQMFSNENPIGHHVP